MISKFCINAETKYSLTPRLKFGIIIIDIKFGEVAYGYGSETGYRKR